jgi:hypothetical protein
MKEEIPSKKKRRGEFEEKREEKRPGATDETEEE